MKNKTVFFLLLLVSKFAFSTIQLDVYGVDDQTAQKIIDTCTTDLEKYQGIEQRYFDASWLKRYFLYPQVKSLYKKIVTDINQFGDYKIVKLGTTTYPNQTKYTTVNIVQAAESFRIPKTSQRIVDNSLTLNQEEEQLFDLYSKYILKNYKLFVEGKLDSQVKSCPAPHCVWGFDKDELVTYYPKFRNFANEHFSALKKIIHTSADEEQRENAIFILGHADSYHEISRFLLNYLNDENPTVRNNAMRVLGGISMKHRVENLPLQSLFEKLVSPYDAERNKAEIILYNIVSQDSGTHKQVIKKSGSALIKLLKLKQPNNHDLAYKILKKVSHKNFAERDYQSWEQWVKQHA